MSSPRHDGRRLFLALLALPVLFLFFLYLGSFTSRRTLSDLVNSTPTRPSKLPDEIFGLLHFVTSPDEAGRVITTVGDATHDGAGPEGGSQPGGAVTPEKPIAMAWYALGSIAYERSESRGWEERQRALRSRYPLVVFSKTYCPYSKRAKRLLETYALSPPPKIVEVDLRADASHIKTLLTRLTGHSTFPNVILHGHSLGGSDDLVRLHEEGQLQKVLENAGIHVRRTGEGDVLL